MLSSLIKIKYCGVISADGLSQVVIAEVAFHVSLNFTEYRACSLCRQFQISSNELWIFLIFNKSQYSVGLRPEG